MLSKRVSEILNFQILIFIFLSQNLEGEKIKTDFTKLNFFSQKQKPIRNFFYFDQPIWSNWNYFWAISILIGSWQTLFWKKSLENLFWRWKKWFLNDFKNDPERRITASRDFLITAKITLKPESCDYSLVLKNHEHKFNLYFRVEILKISCFLEKSLNKTPFRENEDGRWGVEILLSHFICRVHPNSNFFDESARTFQGFPEESTNSQEELFHFHKTACLNGLLNLIFFTGRHFIDWHG